MIADEFGANASYVGELLQQFEKNPESVDEEWREFFETLLSTVENTQGPGDAGGSPVSRQTDGSGTVRETPRIQHAPASAASPAAATEARRAPAGEATEAAKAPAEEERIPLRGSALR